MLKNIIGHDLTKEKLRSFLKMIPPLIIFTGPRGVGKKFTALNFIDEVYGGTVSMIDHPDIRVYSPEGTVFKLGGVQEIQQEITLTPFELDRKFFILTQVDRMNKEAANACLKMFEDIPKHTHFFLTCQRLEQVLPTIRSRALIVPFSSIKDIEAHYPTLSKIEAQIVNGSVGKIGYVKDHNLEQKYNEIFKVFSNFSLLTFSGVLDFYVSLKEIEPDILADLFILCSRNLADSKKSIFLKEILAFKNKLNFNLNYDTHLKLCLLNIRNSLGENLDV